MSNICIVVFVGLPGVGKTHFYKYFSENLYLQDIKLSYISYDEQEKNMERTEYKNFRSIVYEKVENLLRELIENISKEKEVIIIDDNMYYRSMRHCFYNLAKKNTISFCEVFFECSADLALERNSARSVEDRVPSKTIIEMSTKLEPPTKYNSWEQYSCTIQTQNDYTEDDLRVVSELIQNALKNPVHIEEEEETENISNIPQKSASQNVDLALRKIVGRRIKDAILENKSKLIIEALSEELLIKKKKILDNIKKKDFFLPDYNNDEELDKILCAFLENIETENDEVPAKKIKYCDKSIPNTTTI